jgi:V/A-type H+-transporting ATPase subunit K
MKAEAVRINLTRAVLFEEQNMETGLGVGLAAVGAGLAVGLAAIGTGLAQARIGSAGAGVIAEKPEALGTIILLVAIPETMVILGFAIAAMILLLGG